MRVAVFGAGGVGGYYGARLAASGVDVCFIARGAHLAALRRTGLRLESVAGNLHLERVRATDRPEGIGAVDWVLCGVKAWQVTEAAETMGPLLGPESTVLPLQNGVDAADQLAAVLGSARVVGGATWILAYLEAPGVIRHTGFEPRVVFGERGGERSSRVKELAAALSRAGVQAQVSEDIASVIWTKFLFIAAVSGIGAVTRLPVGGYRDVAECRDLLVAALEEAAALARAENIALADDVVAATLDLIDRLPPDSTASMQRDIGAGRPSELESQSGAVVRRARRLGVPTPAHDYLYAALLPGELARRAGAQPPGAA